MSNNVSTLLDELSSFKLPITPQRSSSTYNVTEENVGDYILKKTSELVDTGISAIEDLKDIIIQGQNPDEIAALSELISSTTKSLEIINKINLQNKKIKADKEIKAMDVQSRREIANSLPANTPNTVNNTNILVASREEIFKKFLADTNETTLEIIDSKVLEDK